jgi:hypothetical protein
MPLFIPIGAVQASLTGYDALACCIQCDVARLCALARARLLFLPINTCSIAYITRFYMAAEWFLEKVACPRVRLTLVVRSYSLPVRRAIYLRCRSLALPPDAGTRDSHWLLGGL